MTDKSRNSHLNVVVSTITRSVRYSVLLVMMVVLYLAAPLLESAYQENASEVILDAITTLTLASLVITVSDSRKHLHVGVGFALVSLMLTWAPVDKFGIIEAADYLTLCAFELFALVLTLGFIFSRDEILPEHVMAGAATYFLLGFAWGHVFMTIQICAPESLLVEVDHNRHLTFSDVVYFSFTNLSSLGYGDIIPVRRIARALAALEAVCGQLFTAVLLGRIVGLSLRQDSRKVEKGQEHVR